MRRTSSALGLALVFALGCAHAQDLKAAQACARLGDDAARLSCYDIAMGIAKGASEAAKPQPARANGTDSQAKVGDDGRLHTEVKTPLPKNLTAQVRKVTPLPAGRYRLALDSGQVWDTTQADSSLAFKENDAVTITRGLLGGYEIALAGHTTGVSVVRRE